jgi:hypothetical protein
MSRIFRGAVLREACTNAVSRREARRHYGVSAYTLFDPKRHPAACKEWDSKEEEYHAVDRMFWFVSKVS